MVGNFYEIRNISYYVQGAYNMVDIVKRGGFYGIVTVHFIVFRGHANVKHICRTIFTTVFYYYTYDIMLLRTFCVITSRRRVRARY